MTLYILGNGFDLAHKLPTAYWDFRTYLKSAHPEFLEAFEEHYDIYLLDVVMPGLNGIELAKEIRSSDKAADIIFLTSSPEFAVESYTVKASNYLVKPV